MILGIDFGATTTDVVLFNGKRILRKESSAKQLGSEKKLNSFLKKKDFASKKISAVAVTGGKNSFFKGKVLGNKPTHVEEIEAIGFGGCFLAGLKHCLVVSMGTGTCIVSFDRGKARHVAGTALGGGTIVGLSKRLFGEGNPEKLGKMALNGSLKKIDLSVEEIVGKGIGIIPAKAAASNFAKNGKASKADLALAVQNTVAESNAIIAALSAKYSCRKKIVFVGKTAAFPAVKATVRRVLGYYGFKPIFSGLGEHATAIGAAYCLWKKSA